MPKYILSIDQGTTNTRCALVDEHGRIVYIKKKEVTQIFPQKGWVEQNPLEILSNVETSIRELMAENHVSVKDMVALAITNQRETTVVWDKHSGKPIYNALVWQDSRTVQMCHHLKEKQWEKYVHDTTGLPIDTYFSSTKLNWILDHVSESREKAKQGDFIFGTIDTWLLWNLSEGRIHATDVTNASRTMLFNIKSFQWDKDLLDLFKIPLQMMPDVIDSSGLFGEVELQGQRIAVAGVAGDQQASTFGQACFREGDIKNTYGTGSFLVANTGEVPLYSKHGLLTTIAWKIGHKVTYALEGSILTAGAAIQWLRDGLHIIEDANQATSMAMGAGEKEGLYFVPAFSGLGAPYWDMDARAGIYGITFDVNKEDIVKAALQSMAYQTKDVLNLLALDLDRDIAQIRVDGGACSNDYLMQFQADICNLVVERAQCLESTIIGAAYLAGLGIGFWTQDDLTTFRKTDKRFVPHYTSQKIGRLYEGWTQAVERSRSK